MFHICHFSKSLDDLFMSYIFAIFSHEKECRNEYQIHYLLFTHPIKISLINDAWDFDARFFIFYYSTTVFLFLEHCRMCLWNWKQAFQRTFYWRGHALLTSLWQNYKSPWCTKKKFHISKKTGYLNNIEKYFLVCMPVYGVPDSGI